MTYRVKKIVNSYKHANIICLLLLLFDIQIPSGRLLFVRLTENITPQRRNSAFFLDEKKQSIFFLKMVDTNLMNEYQKEKNRSSGENEIFAYFIDFFFVSKN